ncbi:MAG: alpha/beta hydrolase [Candidatus Marinimicrobia bacterium]|nr:alpha/beta hydrolase [Candidatus Neomarinimicrobiota bacterium]MCF7921466.1 alpha/beta hydrolase [Candidatus Neomarinimicrobiota bacterium]
MMYPPKVLVTLLIAAGFVLSLSYCAPKEPAFQTILLPTSDGLTIKADVYEVVGGEAPVILLFHQARYSRGEYRSIAPHLNELGFTCLAIDQRSGDKIKGVSNDTYAQATKREMGTDYIDAYPDLELLLDHAKKTYPNQKIIIWGSSYSASLAIVLASQHPEDISALLTFSPGTYFNFKGKTIVDYARLVQCPVFMTCSLEEAASRREIFDAIPAASKTFFTPEFEGYHGSKALWPEQKGNEQYWEAVATFLDKYK